MAKGKSYRIPPIAWCFALLIGATPAFAANRSLLPLPPQPVPVRVRVMRGTAVEIPLRVYGDSGRTVTFQVRGAPENGRVTEPRSTGRDSAVVIYQQSDDGTHSGDRFLFVAKSPDGVSAAAEVTIRIVDPDPVFVIPRNLDFGTVTVGEPANELLTIENRTGGVAEGRVECSTGWKIEGDPAYRLAAGESKSLVISCIETREGELQGAVRYTSNPTQETELVAKIEAPLGLSPAPVELHFDPVEKRRAGVLRITNRGPEPRTVQIEHSERLFVQEKGEVPGGGEVSLRIETAPGDTGSVDEQLLVISGRFIGQAGVRARIAGPILRADKPQLAFGPIRMGVPASLTIEVENTGDLPASVRAETTSPFYVSAGDNAFSLEPGGRHVLRVGVQPAQTGAYQSKLSIKAGTSEVLLPLEVRGVSQPSGSFAQAASPPQPSLWESPPLPAAPEVEPGPPRPLFLEDAVSGSPNVPPVNKAALQRTGPDWCELVWPAPTGLKLRYQIEVRRLGLDSERNLRADWSLWHAVSFSERDQKVTAVVKRLTPGWFYTFRVSAINASGEFSVPTGPISVQAAVRPPAFTAMRVLLGCLAALIGYMFWQRRALAAAVEAETKPYESVVRKDWWE